jgi:pantoate--beta-alanine ligase
VQIARTRGELAAALAGLREERSSLALVPTMGFLHDGHLSLVDHAAELCDGVVVSIFVNPLQFGPAEDLGSYPRSEARDLELLRDRGTALAFVPDRRDMYPVGDPLVTVSPGTLERRLCGAFRPGHFRGVLTVVAKLFGLVRPDAAVFGRKDFQQAALIRRMVEDLDLGVRIAAAPIVREADGLAMSSRNSYLGPQERRQAVGLHHGLVAAEALWRGGERRAVRLLDEIRRRVDRFPLLSLQYAEAVDPHTLESVDDVVPGTVLALAAFCGTTRLIDNVELN